MPLSRLQIAILEDGRKQNDIAAECGFPASRLSEYIHGRRAIPPNHLIALCESLELNPDQIIGEIRSPQTPEKDDDTSLVC